MKIPAPLALACGPVTSLALISVLTCIYPCLGSARHPRRAPSRPPSSQPSSSSPRVSSAAPSQRKPPAKRPPCAVGKTPHDYAHKTAGASSGFRIEGGSAKTRAFGIAAPLCYIAVALAVASYALLEPIVSPDAIVFSHDNVRHLGQIECFAQSGIWSSLTTTLYPSPTARSSTRSPPRAFTPRDGTSSPR